MKSGAENSLNKKMACDRLSSLPEDIIIHILGDMEIQDAVRTCVLSKQWNETRLWTKLPSLHINADSFVNLDLFQYFLIRLFIRYDSSNLCSLTLVCNDYRLDIRLVDAIIDYATSNKVKRLSIACRNMHNFQLPSQLSTCRSLEDLTLECLNFKFPIPFYFTFLRSIVLHRVCIGSDILLDCINLENFSMVKSAIDDLRQISLCAPKLVELDIEYERLGFDDYPKEMRVLISAPRLESLSFSSFSEPYLNVSVDKCPTLESASIDIYHTLRSNNKVLRRRKYALHLVDFLKDVSAAKSLTLSAGIIKALSAFPDLVKGVPSPFHNLKHLKVLKDDLNRPVIIPQEVETFFVGGSPNSTEVLNGLDAV